MGQFEDVLAECAVCGELLAQFDEDDPLRVRLACYTDGNLGSARRNLGQLEEAVEAYERTLATAQATGERNIEAEVRHWLGRTLIPLARLKAAHEHLDEAVALARETGHTRWEVGALAGVAEVALLENDFAAAEAPLAEAREIVERTGPLGGMNGAWVVTARVHLARGDAAAAVRLLEPALRQAEDDRCDVDRANVLPDLAAAEHRLGHHDQAHAHLREAHELAERMGLAELLARLRLLRAALTDGPDADADLAAVVEVARAHDLVELLVASLGLRARRHPEQAEADRAEAEAVLARVADAAGPAYLAAARARHLAALPVEP